MPPTPSSLAAVARERSRALAPVVWVSVCFYLIGAPLLGVHLSPRGLQLELAVLGAFTALTVVIMRRAVPERFIYLASAAVVWSAIAATVIGLYTSGNTALFVFLVFQNACCGVMLSTPFVIGTLAGTSLVALPFLLDLDTPQRPLYIAALVTTSITASAIHIAIRRSTLRAAANHHAQLEVTDQLQRQLRELEASYAQRKQLEDQLLHAQRMEAVGTLAAGIAHDMNNVLASITSFAELAFEDAQDANSRENLQQIIEQAARGGSLTRGLLTFSRRNRYRKQVVRAADVLRQVMPLLERTLPRSIELVTHVHDADVPIEGDPIHLGQMIVNLAINAADAMHGTGTLTVSLEVIELETHAAIPAGRYVRITVADTGHGMDDATRQRIFEPFFTTKPLGQGTGLGLSTVWGVVRGHDGAIEVESAPGVGTTFVVLLPVSTEKPAALAARTTSGPIRKATVLVVDDEDPVRESTCRLLQRMGLRTLSAGNGAEALELFRQSRDPVELVVLDMGMPVMGGARCFQELRTLAPELPVLVCTGYAAEQEAQALVSAGARLLEKPFAAAELRKEVSRSLGLSVKEGPAAA